jgi:protein-S-isoprenylcysteine O-methyltransferase Ste14
MALIHSFEKNGNLLFRYRGQIPILIFLAAVPAIYYTDYSWVNETKYYVMLGISIALSFVGFMVRAITIGTTPRNTSGRNTKEQIAEVVNKTGIYSTVRHPLYLGNYFMWIGIVFYTFNFWFVLVISLAYWIYYERIMFAEERFLEKKFGDEYVSWSNSVPPFWPSFKNKIPSKIPFSLKSVLRREYSGFIATVAGFVFVDIVRDWMLMPTFKFNMNYAWVFGIGLLITLVLRTLKKNTKILEEDGRW